MVATRNNTRLQNRAIRHNVYGENARQAIGKIEKGCEIFGLTKGDISIVNIISEVVRQVGKCDVVVATWAAAGYDTGKLKEIKDNGLINNISFILDYSAESKLGKERFAALRSYFPDNVYLTKIHAKFILIKNENWNIVIRTSMNLNENKRMENFEISDCEILYNYLSEIAKDIMKNKSYDAKEFEKLGKDKKYNEFIPKKNKALDFLKGL